MFFDLLQYGEYTIGRPGKKNYAKYTYVIDGDKIIFKVDLDSHDIKLVRMQLYKEIKSLGINTQISNDDDTEIHLPIDAFQSYAKEIANHSELLVALESIQLLLDLITDVKLEKTLEKIIDNRHPLFHLSADNEGNCYYKIRPYISVKLAEYIARIFQQKVCHYLKQQGQYTNQDTSAVVTSVKTLLIRFESSTVIKVAKQAQKDLTDIIREKSTDEDANRTSIEAALSLASDENNNTHKCRKSYKQIYESLSSTTFEDTPNGRKTMMSYFGVNILYAQENEKADFKKICLPLITQIFYKMTDLAEIADLFDHLLNLQTQLDVHKNPWRDSIFRIKNTESWQKLIGDIRNHAFAILEKKYGEYVLDKKFDDATSLLNTYRNRNIFAVHRANGLFSLGNTEAVKDIDDKIAFLSFAQ